MKKEKKLKMIGLYVALAIGLIAFLFPIYWMALCAFRSNNGLMQWPLDFAPVIDTLENVVNIFTSAKYGRYIRNSLIVAGCTMVLCIILSVLAGYPLSRYKFPFRKTIMSTILSSQMFPMVAILISLYTMFVSMKLTNTYFGLILACLCSSMPLSVWMMKSFYDTIPKSLDEAARIDGCGRIDTLRLVIFPLLKPGVYAVGIYSFLQGWDDYLFSKIIINVNEKKTLGVGIVESFLGEFCNNYAGMMALAVIASLPVVVIFIIFQRFLISGMTAGAVKE